MRILAIIFSIIIAIFLLIPFLDANAQTLTVPDSPTDLIADDVSPTQVDLQWNEPLDDGGSPIIGYKIEYRIGTGNYVTLVANTGNANTLYSHSNLNTGTTYIYRIWAINSVGTSDDPSAEDVAIPLSSSEPPEDIPPNPPTGLTTTDVSPTQVELSWNKPSSNNGPPVSGYKIEVKIGTGSFSTLVADTGSTGRTYSDTGLTTGTTYTYKVYAINSIGLSNSTSEASATPTSSSAPPVGNEVPKLPRNFKASAASATEISLSWEPPATFDGPSVTGYKIEFKIGTEDFTDLVDNTTLTSYLHSGLTEGTTYTYRISAINSIGTGSTAQSSAKPEHTSIPTNLVATAVSPTQIDLSWSQPSQTFGLNIVGYNIEKKIAIGIYDLILQTSGPATSVSLQNLETDKTYTFRITARFGLGSSGFSDDVSATPTETSGPSTTSPSPPALLTIINVSPTKNVLSWSPPEVDGGEPVTGYKIEVKVDVGSFEVLASNTGSTMSYTHTPLPSGIEFLYKVSAINSVGIGAPNTKSITMSEQEKFPILGPPKGLTLTLASPSQINLVWLPPDDDGGEPITGYKIEYRIGIGSYQTADSNTKSNTTQYEHKGLSSSGAYYYRVSAINSAGESIPTIESQIIIQLDEPEPKAIPDFIDTENDPQYYLDRYYTEEAYKAWFDRTYPDYTIET